MTLKDSKSVKMINLVCKKYITLNSNVQIEFKSLLNSSVKKREIYEIDALYIILELMYRINNDYDNNYIQNILKTLINQVKEYNSKLKFDLINTELFFKDYTYEKNILIQYLGSLDFESRTVEKPNKKVLKKIKSSISHLSSEDLCFILDYNPELNSYNKSQLKKEVVDKLINYSVDVNKLKDASCDEIKNYLNSLENKSKSSFDIDGIIAVYSSNKNIETNKINNQIKNYATNFYKSENDSTKLYKKSSKNISHEKPKKLTRKNETKVNKRNNDQLTVLKFRKQIEFIKGKSNRPAKKQQTTVTNDISRGIAKAVNKNIRKNQISDNVSKIEKSNLNNNSTNITAQKNQNINKNSIKKEKKVFPSISDIILEKIKLFNKKSLSSMLFSKGEYEWIYDEISKDTFDDLTKNKEVQRFKYYYENFDKIKESNNFITKIKWKKHLLDKFQREMINSSFSDSIYFLSKFKELYGIVSVIKKYPDCIKDKIIDEFTNLNYFIQNYERLLDDYDFNTNNYEEKIRLIDIFEKINLFINKTAEERISLKNSYYEIYQEVSNIDTFNLSPDYSYCIDLFIEYYENCEELLDLFNKIRQHKESINNFCGEINGEQYLSNLKRNELIYKYKEVYNLANGIYKYSEGTEFELFNELNNLERFLTLYDDLLNYTEKHKGYEIDNINEIYIENEIQKNEAFFNDIQDENKKRAIVCDEDNIKVVAGAGAGKTFIIEKKINYLIEKKHKDSEKILCLCYTRKSVNQLSKRLNKPSNPHKVKVFTFHEFCRRVSRDCYERNRSDRYLLDSIIRKYVLDMVSDSKKLAKLSEYFSYYSLPHLESPIFDTLEEYEEYREGNKVVSLKKKHYQCEESIETIKGEYVKSLGELLIANYLFMHDIEYEYESKYPYYAFADMIYYRFFYSGAYFSLNQISECSNEDLINFFLDWEYDRRLSEPDFYLPKYDIYLEHFGVDENMEATFLKGEAKEKYELSMKSKEIWHKLYGTRLIKTYYYYLTQDKLLLELEKLLKKNKVTIGQIDKKKIVDMLINNSRVKDFDNFSKLVKSFINIFESKNQQKADFNEFRLKNNSKDIYTKNRQNLFFDIVEEIYNEYYKENKKGTLSHNHEILNALKLIQSKDFKKQYDYIFIDEYQDVNQVRCTLLQELQKNSNAKIFVVGDDWQSIYGFSGSEVELFINFDKYFENPEIINIKENRRNPQKLIDITSDFIIKNEKQDKKELEYYKEVKNPNLEPIKIVKYKKKVIDYELSHKEIEKIKESNRRSKILKLDAIVEDILENSDNPKILILGRNNQDIDDYVGNDLFKEVERKKLRKITYSKKRDLDITYMTIHQSKGLECDEVILLNLEDAYNGFPNKMEDDPILSFVKSNDECEYAEERRLLYVALTRTRNNVYLLTPNSSKSIFIDYLMKYEGVIEKNLEYKVRRKNLHIDKDFLDRYTIHDTHLNCPECGEGKIAIIENHERKTKYVRCNLHPENKYHYDGGPYPASLNDIKYVKKCPSCRGILVRHGNILKCCLNYHEGCMEVDDKLELDIEDLEYDFE